jgi:hypothetical protein
MKSILFLLTIVLGSFTQNCAAQNKNAGENLKPYFLVILKKGPHRDQDSVTAAQIQKARIRQTKCCRPVFR